MSSMFWPSKRIFQVVGLEINFTSNIVN